MMQVTPNKPDLLAQLQQTPHLRVPAEYLNQMQRDLGFIKPVATHTGYSHMGVPEKRAVVGINVDVYI